MEERVCSSEAGNSLFLRLTCLGSAMAPVSFSFTPLNLHKTREFTVNFMTQLLCPVLMLYCICNFIFYIMYTHQYEINHIISYHRETTKATENCYWIHIIWQYSFSHQGSDYH